METVITISGADKSGASARILTFLARKGYGLKGYQIMEAPDTYADFAAQYFCRKQATLKPISVTLLQVVENDYWPDDRLLGKQPRDPDYVTVNTLKTVECLN